MLKIRLTERACWYPSSFKILSLCEHLGPSWNERFRRFKHAFVYSSEGRKEAGPPFGWELAMAARSGSSSSSATCIDFFKPQTHQHWIPRRLRLTSQQNDATILEEDALLDDAHDPQGSSSEDRVSGGVTVKVSRLGDNWQKSTSRR